MNDIIKKCRDARQEYSWGVPLFRINPDDPIGTALTNINLAMQRQNNELLFQYYLFGETITNIQWKGARGHQQKQQRIARFMYDVFKDMPLAIYRIHDLSYTQLRDTKINEAVEPILQDRSNEIVLDEEE